MCAATLMLLTIDQPRIIVVFELPDQFCDRFCVSFSRKALYWSQRCFLKVLFVVGPVEHPLVVDEYLFRQTFKDPWVLQALERSHSIDGIPLETLFNKVQVQFVFAILQHLVESLCKRSARLTPGVGARNRLARSMLEE